MGVLTVQQMADRVSELLAEKLRVRGDTLERRLRKAGRRLPRRVREAAAALDQATAMTRNPKLLHMVDERRLALAYDLCLAHLNRVDPKAARRNLILDMAARMAFALLVVAVLLIATLYWRGLV